jgi:predicted transcriptional regulator
MDKVKKYRQILKSVTEKHAKMYSPMQNVSSSAVCDFEKNNYFLIDFDSNEKKHYIVFHLRLENGKIFVLQDGIEYGIKEDLVEAGISPQEIILNFQGTFQPELLVA